MIRFIEVYRGKDRQWYVRVKARNGKILLHSEGYKRKRDAMRLHDDIVGLAEENCVIEDRP